MDRHVIEAGGFLQRRLDALDGLFVLADREIVQRRDQWCDFISWVPLQPSRQAFGEFANVAPDVLAQERHTSQELHLGRQMQARLRRLAASHEMSVVR
ncbi:hypothetical protein [Mesorhizobium sp. M8A.F.Ca.ET.207.01.1.1]|uniref:hypothetical protein n=1 Tax=Mesorhizobium sp. M8A.F.Ca.ET.207.01.1.1 TaxID=2563968 RepID=UPI001676D68E|nr:hypothetical protein [Mesorhizobium sp. M8A.F.Ca.ET.207.01.1.1]